MTQPADLIAIGSVAIGESEAYYLERVSAAESISAPDGSGGEHYRERVWTMTCIAFAATPADR